MPSTNLPPPVTDVDLLKTLAFPFQRGPSGFPAMADPKRAIFYSIWSLLTTGKNERVMHPELGVNLHRFVFNNLTPILQARVATEVAKAISDFEPRAQVVGVESKMGTLEDGGTTAIIVSVLYRVAGQLQSQQVPIPLAGSI